MAASVLKCPGIAFKIFKAHPKTFIARHVKVLTEFVTENGVVTISTQKRGIFNTHNLRKEQSDQSSQVATKAETENIEDDYDIEREKFIPITRRSMIRHLMQQKDFLNTEELRHFERFSLSLDSAIVNRYHGLLQELKSLFDPINPDKDTIATRQWNRRERLDNEFWLIQKLANVMEKANFHELSRPIIEKALKEHVAQEGVLVSVNPDNYDILRIWALGRQTPQEQLPLYKRLGYAIFRQPSPEPLEFYKRVVVAIRLKRDDKLILKAFKEVPINALEQLLPDGKIKMSQFDKTIISTSIGLASLGIIAKLVTYLAKVQVQWTMILTGVTALTAIRAWTVYKNRRNAYLLDLSRMLYFKNIANNRGLLTLLVDRAEDELFKEALLTYTFLLTNRAPSIMEKDSSDQLPAELGGLPQAQLERKIEDWVYMKTKAQIEFDATDAVKLLTDLGIASEDYDTNLCVLSLDSATRNLPITPQSLVERVEEYDAIEGYDRSVYEETDEEYKDEEKKRKKYGWF